MLYGSDAFIAIPYVRSRKVWIKNLHLFLDEQKGYVGQHPFHLTACRSMLWACVDGDYFLRVSNESGPFEETLRLRHRQGIQQLMNPTVDFSFIDTTDVETFQSVCVHVAKSITSHNKVKPLFKSKFSTSKTNVFLLLVFDVKLHGVLQDANHYPHGDESQMDPCEFVHEASVSLGEDGYCQAFLHNSEVLHEYLRVRNRTIYWKFPIGELALDWNYHGVLDIVVAIAQLQDENCTKGLHDTRHTFFVLTLVLSFWVLCFFF
jgi:hypothetical protein